MRSRSNFKTVSDFTSTASKWRDNEAQTRQCEPHSRQISKQKQNKRADSRCNLMCFLPKKKKADNYFTNTAQQQQCSRKQSALAGMLHLHAHFAFTFVSYVRWVPMFVCIYATAPTPAPQRAPNALFARTNCMILVRSVCLPSPFLWHSFDTLCCAFGDFLAVLKGKHRNSLRSAAAKDNAFFRCDTRLSDYVLLCLCLCVCLHLLLLPAQHMFHSEF